MSIQYAWAEGWAHVPSREDGWAHHGLAVTQAGDLVTFDPRDPVFVRLDAAGQARESWSAPLSEAHGITLVREGDEELLWVADNGSKKVPPDAEADSPAWVGRTGPRGGQVVKLTMTGEVATRLETPPHAAYLGGGTYAPTSVAVDEVRHGGSGDVWVADGYGQGYVHHFDPEGGYLGSFNGEDREGGTFKCPHAIFIDRRRSEPELYVADRGNARVQVFGLDGKFRRVVGTGVLNSPSAFATDGERLVIAELFGRLAVLDDQDALVGYIGEHPGVEKLSGWPNPSPPPTAAEAEGRFNSPHGLAVGADGVIYVSEWRIGGRHVRLEPSRD